MVLPGGSAVMWLHCRISVNRGENTMLKKLLKLLYKDSVWALIFLFPNLICFLVFLLIPVISSFFIGFMKWDLLSAPEFAGVSNYIRLFNDSIFLQTLRNTLVYSFFSVALLIICSLLMAVAVNVNLFGKKAFRTMIFLPVITSNVVVAIMWRWMFISEIGFVNYFLSWFHISGPNWLTDQNWAMVAVIFVSVWKSLGYYMMIFLAGLQSIPSTYYEAVDIDGGNNIVKFFNITIPLLAPTTFFITVMAIIGSFQVFDVVMLMTNGGPGRATSVVVHYLYQNAFRYFDMGYATSMSHVIFALVLIATFIQFRANKSDNWTI
jgi:multiple sugar transport system permease protein